MKDMMLTDCSICPPHGFRIVLFVAAIFKWRITHADVLTAFLQTGDAKRSVYVKPPYESAQRGVYWLLLVATYGLVNANAKWQSKSDAGLQKLGLVPVTQVPQLFVMFKEDKLCLIVAKVVDDLLLSGEEAVVAKFLADFNSMFKLGTITRGPGNLRFYGLMITQDEDCSSTIHGDEKLNALEPYPLSRVRRRQVDQHMSSIETSAYMSINSSLGWLGITSSPLCGLYSSLLQQRLVERKVQNVIDQSNAFRMLKKFETVTKYPTMATGFKEILLVIFADAGRRIDHGQLCFISGILIGPLQRGSRFYVINWTSHKSKRLVKSSTAAETLAAGEAIDNGQMLKDALSFVLGIKIHLTIVVDSKDLYTSLTTQRNSIDRSIRADVNIIRFEYEVGNVDEIVWIPGSTNLADPGTKPDSALSEALQLTLFEGRIAIDFDAQQSHIRNDRTLG